MTTHPAPSVQSLLNDLATRWWDAVGDDARSRAAVELVAALQRHGGRGIVPGGQVVGLGANGRLEVRPFVRWEPVSASEAPSP